MSTQLNPKSHEFETSNPKHRIWVQISMVVLAIATLLVGGYLFATQQSERNEEKYLTNNKQVICVPLAGPRLQCEHLATGERFQYEVPASMGEIMSLVPSPDETKFLISGFDYATGVSKQAVLDSSFSLLHTLPSDSDSATSQYSWHGNKAFIRVTDTYDDTTSTRTFTTVSLDGKPTGTITAPDPFAQLVGSDGTNIYMQYAEYDDIADETANLILVKTGVKQTTQPIDYSSFALDPDRQVELDTNTLFRYDPSSQLFYANNSSSQAGAPNAFKIGKLDGQQLIEAYRVETLAMDNPVQVISAKGVLVNNLNDYSLRSPDAYELLGPDTVITKLKLPVSNQFFFFALTNWPHQNGSVVDNDNQAVSFVNAPVGTPEEITAFMEQRTTIECQSNNYRRVSLVARDGIEQIITSESGCGTDGSHYFIRAENWYIEVYASQEGIACETRDKLGLSEKLVPDCRKPGEGL